MVQPHFIATGGGSAKSEDEARIGLVVGNFLKRFCTVGWAITALIALALLAGNAEIAANPDRVWGIASREILGPVGLGLVGSDACVPPRGDDELGGLLHDRFVRRHRSKFLRAVYQSKSFRQEMCERCAGDGNHHDRGSGGPGDDRRECIRAF